MTKNNNDYYQWLTGLVGGPGPYSFVMETAHSIPFYDKVPNDDNRVADGLELRDEYVMFTSKKYPALGPCTVFEMLIGVAKRMSYIMYNYGGNDLLDRWFMVLIENLDLLKYTDTNERNMDEVAGIFDTLVERNYYWTGRGGLFPLRSPMEDQRFVEIWYQMMTWIKENS